MNTKEVSEAFAKEYPCDDVGAIPCYSCIHRGYCDDEYHRQEMEDAFRCGIRLCVRVNNEVFTCDLCRDI